MDELEPGSTLKKGDLLQIVIKEKEFQALFPDNHSHQKWEEEEMDMFFAMNEEAEEIWRQELCTVEIANRLSPQGMSIAS